MNKLTNNLTKLKFCNSHLKTLFISESEDTKSKSTPKINYSKVKPTPLTNPRLISISELSCKILDLDYEDTKSDKDTPLYLSGNKLLEGSIPISHCYCGHQFGNFAGQLGDGIIYT